MSSTSRSISCGSSRRAGSEGEVIAFVDATARRVADGERRASPSRPGATTCSRRRRDAPLVTLSTHLDTVPPYIPPVRTADRITGRGACDAKGIAAAMICAAERLRDAGVPVALLFVVGEETCHDGAHAANDALRRGDAAGDEPRAHQRRADGEHAGARNEGRRAHDACAPTGRAAHSAYPHLGQSATMGLVRLLAELDTSRCRAIRCSAKRRSTSACSRAAWRTTSSRRAAEARLMARLVGPVDDVVDAVRRVGRRSRDGRRRHEHPAGAPRDGARDRDVGRRVRDGHSRADAWGTPYLFGPGSIHVAHIGPRVHRDRGAASRGGDATRQIVAQRRHSTVDSGS